MEKPFFLTELFKQRRNVPDTKLVLIRDSTLVAKVYALPKDKMSHKMQEKMNLILICDWSPCDDGGYWIWRRGGLGEQHNTSNRKSHKLDPICESTLKGVEG